jgi:hypothetical protein
MRSTRRIPGLVITWQPRRGIVAEKQAIAALFQQIQRRDLAGVESQGSD